tara:strand:- start:169 stop:342 length:174 start_codon:yes stop_codon:yes gene_type:complete
MIKIDILMFYYHYDAVCVAPSFPAHPVLKRLPVPSSCFYLGKTAMTVEKLVGVAVGG